MPRGINSMLLPPPEPTIRYEAQIMTGKPRDKKWRRVQADDVVPGGQPVLVEYGPTECVIENDWKVPDIIGKTYYVDDDWVPPWDGLPERPRWGVVVYDGEQSGWRKFSTGQWVLNDNNTKLQNVQDRTGIYLLVKDIKNFIPLSVEQIAEILDTK